MAIKFQYNKTSLQQMEKQLKVRKRTLPIIKSKESALRMEVKKCKDDLVRLEAELEEGIRKYDSMFALWNEFNPNLIKVADVHLTVRKIAGTRIPVLDTFSNRSLFVVWKLLSVSPNQVLLSPMY